MNQDILKDVCVIIRSSGERTEGLCRYSVLQNEIKEDQIFLIKNISPFSEALKEGYKKAIDSDKEYVFFVDADMILLPGILEKMILEIKKLPDNTFFVNPLAYDYLTGQLHPNGPHLYKIKFLKKALDLIPSEEVSRRPETYTAKKMGKNGYRVIFLNIPSAMHEFEQYYKDIFNRGFNKFIKFPEERWENFKRFKKLKNKNKDFEVATKAFKYASGRRDELKLNNQQFASVFEKIKIKEKEEIKEFDLPELYKGLCEKLEIEKNTYLLKGYNNSERDKKVNVIKRIIERVKIKFNLLF